MKGTAVVMMVLSGLCFLPAGFPRLYILVEKAKTWAEAQSYCRGKYTDLASVHNKQDLDNLNLLLHESTIVWIGLHADTDSWRWSLDERGYYGGQEAGFRMWADGEPNDGPGYWKVCVAMLHTGEWADITCTTATEFICYNGTVGIEDNSSSFIFVTEIKPWKEAQSYCREHYTDLASVRNQAENDQIKMIIQTQTLNPNQHTWIGLYRDSWKWSDGSALSFRNWADNAPSVHHTLGCACLSFGKWVNKGCQSLYEFVCYSDTMMRKQVVRVVLKKTDSVDMEELKEDILEGFNQRLKDHGLSEDVRLRWVKQPDGKIFHKEEKEEKSCGRNPNKL